MAETSAVSTATAHASPRGSGPDGTGPDVLFIEDDRVLARFLRKFLEVRGFQVVLRERAEQGLLAARALSPDVIILDLRLPGMDGCAFLRVLRDDPATARIPVIVWTGKDLTPGDRRTLARLSNAVVRKDRQGTNGLVRALQATLEAAQGDPARVQASSEVWPAAANAPAWPADELHRRRPAGREPFRD